MLRFNTIPETYRSSDLLVFISVIQMQMQCVSYSERNGRHSTLDRSFSLKIKPNYAQQGLDKSMINSFLAIEMLCNFLFMKWMISTEL